MCAVTKHYIAQIAGCFRCINNAFKTVFKELGQHSRMVDMCVREKDSLYFRWTYRQRLVFKYVDSLFHSAVDEIISLAYLKKRTASRNLVGCAYKRNSHKTTSNLPVKLLRNTTERPARCIVS